MAEEAAAREVPRGKWRPDGLSADRIHVCLQQEGDLVLIPPGYASLVRAAVGQTEARGGRVEGGRGGG